MSRINVDYLVWKGIVDYFFGFFGLLLSIPIIIVCGFLIKIDSKGPVFFCQKRVGLNGEIFTILKLRTMVEDAEVDGKKWASPNDPRITKVGALLRKYHLDELPQFINVLKGDISLIGPRPEVPELTTIFSKKNPQYIERLQVKPGLTGWAQINGGYDLSPDEKLVYDLYYLDKLSISFELKIIFRTFIVLVSGKGAR